MSPNVRDWRELPLDGSGRSLIEASAGTGKTWTISVLYLRLLLEQPALTPRRIVVTTFTRPAAEELRERLRGRLLWALQRAEPADSGSRGAAHSDEAWLLQRWQADEAARGKDAARLKLALTELDLAPIGTLHSLCRRILGDHPFASGMPFVLGELADGKAVLNEVARDLWRVFQQGDLADPLVQSLGHLDPKLDEARLRRLISIVLTPGARVVPAPPAQAGDVLPVDYADRLEYFSRSEGVLRKNSKLLRGWAALAAWLRDQSQPVPETLLEELESASKPTTVNKDFRNDSEVLALVAFTVEQCIPHLQKLWNLAQKFSPEALIALADAARARIAQRLTAANQLRYDDLVQGVHAILADRADPARAAQLADTLFAAWPVALVDEFQDTDGLQYGILDRIYRDANEQLRGRLVMIGDPKQAIYRFRGGDIHAYLRAAATADAANRLSLDVNHRSSRKLVAACNAFYALCGSALSTDEDGAAISYREVTASERQDACPYMIDGEAVVLPLQVYWQDNLPEGIDEVRMLALQACADQIAAMLADGRQRIGDAPIKPSDIAVLLPKNAQLDQLRDLLRARGVPCVTTSRASVFASETARELQVILYAIAHCSELGALRAAVATRLWGMNYAELRALGEDPARWQSISGAFRAWQQRWQQRGVHAVVDALIDRVAQGCLARPDGERSLTDLRHLGELLQAEAEHCTGFEELLEWLAAQRAGGDEGGEEDAAEARQLRIESDATRVRLMTLHVSKGLEFPIVFLPLMWDHKAMSSRDLCLLSDAGSGERLVDSSPAARARDLLEQQDECFRVLYVALTRAIHACHVYALCQPEAVSDAAKRSALDAMLLRRNAADLASTAQIAWLEGWPRARGVRYRDAQVDGNKPRAARRLPQSLPGPLPSRHSFTTLSRFVAANQLDPDAAAIDESEVEPGAVTAADVDTAPGVPHPQIEALGSLRGADFGNAVHAVFERRVVCLPMHQQRDLLRQQLALHNITSRELSIEQVIERLGERLQQVLDAPLDAESGLSLAALADADLRVEMEFNFTLQGASMRRLQAICRQPDGSSLVPGSQRSLAGLMTGKIDLCFRHDGRVHVLDYKGNHLGDCIEDYQGESLKHKMDASHYRFQALLYTVAVDRYLRQRIPDYRRSLHLGDCWYLFIRAVGLAPGAGIWRHRFDDVLLDAVDAELAHGLQGEPA